MESLSRPSKVTFEVLRCRLIGQIKLRIDNGQFTERGLSRILGISQSQTHNVLKGARRLQMQLADRIMAKLGLSAMDLLSEDELDAALRLKMVEWDRQIADEDARRAANAEDFDLALLLALKKPAARSSSKRIKDEEQIG